MVVFDNLETLPLSFSWRVFHNCEAAVLSPSAIFSLYLSHSLDLVFQRRSFARGSDTSEFRDKIPAGAGQRRRCGSTLLGCSSLVLFIYFFFVEEQATARCSLVVGQAR